MEIEKEREEEGVHPTPSWDTPPQAHTHTHTHTHTLEPCLSKTLGPAPTCTSGTAASGRPLRRRRCAAGIPWS
jgi:hypothetical protein